ncbi:hypothetical protein VFPFJ_09304 [Purpureocillium lilacinum]|uniref:Uncharacterized protein n=1 Tax=Purpureocillium lilacinum TaxID=33203 RepID=A0A179GUA8_PURLI|nr:hypothetical protein VFPFJ_09304 [Purpureocillium lilacinum]OAQ80851.1 hypothetical protein VFPFJ_09304 [Purpureocillium lilacinum]
MAASETRLSPVRAATQPNPRSRFHRPPGAPASTADPTQREKKNPTATGHVWRDGGVVRRLQESHPDACCLGLGKVSVSCAVP